MEPNLNRAARRVEASNKEHPHGWRPKSKRYLRKAKVAERYDVDPRTVPRMVEDGRLRPPDLYNGRIPLWDEDKLDADDEEREAKARAEREALARREAEGSP